MKKLQGFLVFVVVGLAILTALAAGALVMQVLAERLLAPTPAAAIADVASPTVAVTIVTQTAEPSPTPGATETPTPGTEAPTARPTIYGLVIEPSWTPLPPEVAAAVTAAAAAAPPMGFEPGAVSNMQVFPTKPWPADPMIEEGVLWWPNHPGIDVAVFGPQYTDFPITEYNEDGSFPGGELAARLAEPGGACLANAGDRVRRDDTIPHPDFAAGIEVLTGPCKGFRGWVGYPQASIHYPDQPLGTLPTATPTPGAPRGQ